MTKSEELGKLIGMPKEVVEEEIDRGMWDILIELNKKNYYTIYCCEGHCNDNARHGVNYWEGYIAFAETYKFMQFPKGFYKVGHNRKFFYWQGNGEESRQKYLSDLLNWARCLPTRQKRKITTYHLLAKHKNQPNREPKILCYTQDYEEIRCILNRADMEKYFDFELVENVRYE